MKSVAIIGVISLGAMTLWACAGPSKVDADASKSKLSRKPAKSSRPADLSRPETLTPDQVAAQIARDNEALRQLQPGWALPKEGEVVTDLRPDFVDPIKEVKFNDPAVAAAGETSTPVPQSPVNQAPLAKDPSGSNLPVTNLALPGDLEGTLVMLSKELYRRAADADSPMADLLSIASMSLADPDRPFDAAALPGITDREREILTAFNGFCRDLSKDLRSSGDSEAAVDMVQKLKEALAPAPVLKIHRTDLCTRVGGFGDIDPFEKNVFLAGNSQKVIVYAEIGEFTSELNARNEWLTDLAVELVIFSDRDGIPVWKQAWQSASDVSKNKRRDFFLTQIITLSNHLTVGAYTLKVRVRDEQSGAMTETGIQFQMVADPGMAVQFPKR